MEEQRTAQQLVAEVKERCAANRMTVTLWLLFDTAAKRDCHRRDSMLRDFKKYARAHNYPRSVAVGATWLEENMRRYAA